MSEDPLVYSFDTPGVMLPFLGRGDRGAERGVKLALIGRCLCLGATYAPATRLSTNFAPGPAGIKEGLYDNEALAAYLLYRLNALDKTSTCILSYQETQHKLSDFCR